MSLEEVSASAIRAEIREIITPTRRQIRESLNKQKESLAKITETWLELDRSQKKAFRHL